MNINKNTELVINDLQNQTNIEKKVIDVGSSQKKNVFYLAFKNIKERFQFREQRTNKIKTRT